MKRYKSIPIWELYQASITSENETICLNFDTIWSNSAMLFLYFSKSINSKL